MVEFFKVFLPDYSSNELVIPPAFIEILKKPLPREVTLVDENKRLWCMETETEILGEGFQVLFKKGWDRFVIHHSLRFGDFLIFKYDGVSKFSVVIFGRNGCRKDKIRVPVKEKPRGNNVTKPKRSRVKVKPSGVSVGTSACARDGIITPVNDKPGKRKRTTCKR